MKLTLILAFATTLLAQTASEFEVASIKPDDSGGNRVETVPGGVRAQSATLSTLIQWAYRVQGNQIAGADSAASGQLQSDRYTIVAKTAASAPETQLRLMMQQLLAQRFHLALHRETRDLRSFALLVDKNGPKFHESKDEGDSQQQATSKLTRKWQRTAMSQFADSLSDAMQAPVLDQTGLSGKYDFALDLSPFLPTGGERPDISLMMVSAIREQLGLKLESRKAPAEVLVIDHLEKPAAN